MSEDRNAQPKQYTWYELIEAIQKALLENFENEEIKVICDQLNLFYTSTTSHPSIDPKHIRQENVLYLVTHSVSLNRADKLIDLIYKEHPELANDLNPYKNALNSGNIDWTKDVTSFEVLFSDNDVSYSHPPGEFFREFLSAQASNQVEAPVQKSHAMELISILAGATGLIIGLTSIYAGIIANPPTAILLMISVLLTIGGILFLYLSFQKEQTSLGFYRSPHATELHIPTKYKYQKYRWALIAIGTLSILISFVIITIIII